MTIGEFELALFLTTETILLAATAHAAIRRRRRRRHPTAASLRALQRAHQAIRDGQR